MSQEILNAFSGRGIPPGDNSHGSIFLACGQDYEVSSFYG